MRRIVFPAEWGVLKQPHVRWYLLLEFGELSDPFETSRWLNPDPAGPIVGIDETVHFFFDDHQFDGAAIGWCFFDDEEVRVVQAVIQAIDDVIGPGTSLLSNREVLAHPAWPKVEQAARAALEHLRMRGVPIFEESDQ